KKGMETTLGEKVLAGAIFDRDYRCQAECASIADDCRSFCDFVIIHGRKEIENFLLVPSAIDRAARKRAMDREKRTGSAVEYTSCAHELLHRFADDRKSYIAAQILDARIRFERPSASVHATTISERALTEFEVAWKDTGSRLYMVPGKEAVGVVNQRLQEQF